MPHGGTHYNPTQWETGFGAGMEDMYTPAQQFAQFRTGFRPDWQYQLPLSRLQNQLTTRYMLGDAPQTTGPAGWAGNTFRDYLGTINPGTGQYIQDYATLRARAQEAADIANMTEAQLEASPIYGIPGTPAAARWASYRDYFGGNLENQANLVNLLAQQRPASMGGGQYNMRMSQAIENMLGSLLTARTAQGEAPSNFLQWYLDQTANTA